VGRGDDTVRFRQRVLEAYSLCKPTGNIKLPVGFLILIKVIFRSDHEEWSDVQESYSLRYNTRPSLVQAHP
jgi:hypothetical protein